MNASRILLSEISSRVTLVTQGIKTLVGVRNNPVNAGDL